MQRALTSGVSGMLNNQLVLDVTANNLANVNTTGFKSSTVSFANALIQTEFAGSAPGSAIGGQNPKQVGLGMQSSAISLDMRQGSLQSTGRNLDLAIQGEGFFEVSNGTSSAYTRVGNFGFDSKDNMVDLGTGYKVIGNTYNTQTNPDGSQSILAINSPLNIPRNEAFPPKRTEVVTMQGNLNSNTKALRGPTLQSVYPLFDSQSGKTASEDTKLQNLSIFAGGPAPASVAAQTRTMYVFGTKPNGEAYAGTFTINPWDTPTPLNGKSGTVGNLLAKLNNALAQGNERFGSVRLDNGNLVASGVGTGDGFSLFFGEDPGPNGGTSNSPIAGLVPFGEAVLDGFSGIAYAGVAMPGAALDNAVAAAKTGLINPSFTVPARNYSPQSGANMRISVKINGIERGTITIPAADYSAAGAKRTFKLDSMPHIAANDVIAYDLAGSLDLTQGGTFTTASDVLTWSSPVVDDANSANLTADIDHNGTADMFQEGTSTDVNDWIYKNETNSTLNWYRSRMVPESVSSSIEVYDSQGGKHTIEAKYIRIGTRTDPSTGARINSWDLIVGVKPGEGAIKDDLVAGIEFDQAGRYTGAVGTSIHNHSFNDINYVGNPADANVQLDWTTTGPTDPATMRMNLGDSNSYKGLTSFGSSSTAAAVGQDGYTDGKLDTLSVSNEGDVVGLYTNGVSRKLAQLSLATFKNPAGLSQQGNNLFTESVNSGTPTRRIAGQGAGFITSGALEGGNVDIATEFTRIITAQRGFQVSARVIQTTDQLLQELANLIK